MFPWSSFFGVAYSPPWWKWWATYLFLRLSTEHQERVSVNAPTRSESWFCYEVRTCHDGDSNPDSHDCESNALTLSYSTTPMECLTINGQFHSLHSESEWFSVQSEDVICGGSLGWWSIDHKFKSKRIAQWLERLTHKRKTLYSSPGDAGLPLRAHAPWSDYS